MINQLLNRIVLFNTTISTLGDGSLTLACELLEKTWMAECKILRRQLVLSTRELTVLVVCIYYSELIEIIGQENEPLKMPDILNPIFRNDLEDTSHSIEKLKEEGWLENHLDPTIISLTPKMKKELYQPASMNQIESEKPPKLSKKILQARAYITLFANRPLWNEYVSSVFQRDLLLDALTRGQIPVIGRLPDDNRPLFSIEAHGIVKEYFLLPFTGGGAMWDVERELLEKATPIVIEFSHRNIFSPIYYQFDEAYRKEALATKSAFKESENYCGLKNFWFIRQKEILIF